MRLGQPRPPAIIAIAADGDWPMEMKQVPLQFRAEAGGAPASSCILCVNRGYFVTVLRAGGGAAAKKKCKASHRIWIQASGPLYSPWRMPIAPRNQLPVPANRLVDKRGGRGLANGVLN